MSKEKIRILKNLVSSTYSLHNSECPTPLPLGRGEAENFLEACPTGNPDKEDALKEFWAQKLGEWAHVLSGEPSLGNLDSEIEGFDYDAKGEPAISLWFDEVALSDNPDDTRLLFDWDSETIACELRAFAASLLSSYGIRTPHLILLENIKDDDNVQVLNDAEFWEKTANEIGNYGFPVYNSDTRFIVYNPAAIEEQGLGEALEEARKPDFKKAQEEPRTKLYIAAIDHDCNFAYYQVLIEAVDDEEAQLVADLVRFDDSGNGATEVVKVTEIPIEHADALFSHFDAVTHKLADFDADLIEAYKADI